MLGGKVASEIVRQGKYGVRALVRNLAAKAHELAPFAAQGVELVEGDVLAPATLDAAVDGISAIVSAVNNQEELIVQGQTNLVRAAEKHGVQRFIPSDFSVDYRKLSLGDNHNLDMRLRFLPTLLDANMEHTLVLNGAFHEVLAEPFLGFVDAAKQRVNFWGNAEQPLDSTSTADTARYVAATVLDPRTANQALRIAGDRFSPAELAAALPGYTLHRQGEISELKQRIAAKKNVSDNPWAYLGDQYLWSMQSGAGLLDTLDNSLYPEIKPISAPEFLRAQLTNNIQL
jgi:uncharacterized protein YbjT (DUF2867 family)